MRTVDEWKTVLRDALRAATRARNLDAVGVLRETLAAIDNAEAADPSAAPPVGHGAFANSAEGLGAGEVARRVLSPADVAALVDRELAERRAAAAQYAGLGRHDDAARLQRQIDELERLGT